MTKFERLSDTNRLLKANSIMKLSTKHTNKGCLIPFLCILGLILTVIIPAIGIRILVYGFPNPAPDSTALMCSILLIFAGFLCGAVVAILFLLQDIQENTRTSAQLLKEIEAKLKSDQDKVE